MRIGVLIPVRDPGPQLEELVRELLARELPVVLVDDGSARGRELLEELDALPGVTLLTHPAPSGRGAALKTGLAHLLEAGFEGAVTAAGDGRHTGEDIARMAEALAETPDTLILGAGGSAGRKALGGATRVLLRLLYGMALTDPLTDLRGIPLGVPEAEKLPQLKGERADYEALVLREAASLFPGGVREVPVERRASRASGGDPFRSAGDAWRILLVLLHKLPTFILSSATAFGLDYLLFNLLYYVVLPQFSGATFLATVGARICSAGYNYLINKHVVFKGSGSAYNAKRFFTLAAGVLMANLLIMHLLVDLLGLPAFLVKIPVDAVLFLVNFTVQHAWARKGDKKT